MEFSYTNLSGRVNGQKGPAMDSSAAEPVTVLVIDDEKPTLTMFRLFLRAYGYDVICAENGFQGLEMFKAHHPRIVFTDLKMPEMDGIELLKRIKQQAPRTEVIVITGHGDMDLAMQALNLEASDFINKPIDRIALEAALDRAKMRLAGLQGRNCRLTFEQRGKVSLVRIEGTLSGKDETNLARLVEKSLAAGSTGLLLSFTPHSALDGTGIGALGRLIAGSDTGRLAVAASGLSVNFTLLLKMVGLTRFMELYSTEQEGLDALASSSVR